MHVLFVTSEVAGVFKIGGLADVSQALPVALGRQGISVTVTLPFYKTIDVSGVSGVGELAVNFAGKREIVFIFSKPMGVDGVTLLLFRHPKLNDYFGHPIEETFAFYNAVISTFYLYSSHLLSSPVDIVHCHDWHTSLVPLLVGESNKVFDKKETIQSKNVRTIITIHNLLYQGVAQDSIIEDLNAPRELFHIRTFHGAKKISFLRESLECADQITTVSPTYAREITAQPRKDSIGDVLVRRRARTVGVLNGIDLTLWDPKTDIALPEHYDATSVKLVKSRLKSHLQRELGLPQESLPLFGFVGRIEPRQKGIDIVMEALKDLIDTVGFQVVLLGTGDPQSVHELMTLARKHKKYIAFIHAFDDGLARRIYAGSDCLLVPSKFEPCGLTQMIAMRYGTVPLVRNTGGLADSVVDGKTGLVFEAYSGHALAAAIQRAINLWTNKKGQWENLIRNGMAQDFSWDRSAKRYMTLYRSL